MGINILSNILILLSSYMCYILFIWCLYSDVKQIISQIEIFSD